MLRVLASFLLLATVMALRAQAPNPSAAAAAPGPAAPPQVQAQSQGQLDGSPALFTVLAAINAAGYDAEIQSPSNHPMRAAVRAAVAARKPASQDEIRRFYAAHRRDTPNQDLSQYISYALAIDGPPSFKPLMDRQSMPPDTIALEGFDKLLARFSQEAGLESLWKEAQPAFDDLAGRYHGPVTQAVFDINTYLRNPTSGFRGKRFQVYFDLLGAPNQIHTRSYGDDYFVVITPSAEVKSQEIKAAYLHYLLDPLSMRFQPNWSKKRGLGDLAGASPVLDEAYKNDFVLLGGMCVVKAVAARLSPPAQRAALVDRAMKEGFILTAYFYESLPAYEKQEQAMRLYLPQMIDAIDIAKEDKRIAQIEFTNTRTVKTVKAPAPPKPAELTGVAKDLESAETLYENRDLAAARQAYRKVIQTEAPKPVHAKAYYGLARISALEKNPELSEQLFQRTLELEPEPSVKAWTHVYLGRLAQAAREPEEARRQFQAALGVTGGSQAARTAAQKGLEAIPPRQEN